MRFFRRALHNPSLRQLVPVFSQMRIHNVERREPHLLEHLEDPHLLDLVERPLVLDEDHARKPERVDRDGEGRPRGEVLLAAARDEVEVSLREDDVVRHVAEADPPGRLLGRVRVESERGRVREREAPPVVDHEVEELDEALPEVADEVGARRRRRRVDQGGEVCVGEGQLEGCFCCAAGNGKESW